jgi:hypothetical protein
MPIASIWNKILSFAIRFSEKVKRMLYEINNQLIISRVFPEAKIRPVISINRKTLAKVENWIENEVYDKSIFQYGLPQQARDSINKDVGNEITYTDAMLFLSRNLKKSINYLELGVSVGKNFIQVANFFDHSTITGLDVEEINPVLECLLDKVSCTKWVGNSSMKLGNSSLTEYIYNPNHNQVFYVNGDILDENTWKALSGRKFNMIFSDAFHSPEALLYEYSMIKSYELLDADEFLFVWDDLGDEMTTSFMQIWHELRQKYNLRSKSKLIISLRGWIGINEGRHLIGIVMKVNKGTGIVAKGETLNEFSC